MVDTTCGSVLNVWKNVKRYAQDGFTSVIHGKVWHEETQATASQALTFANGHFLVVLEPRRDQRGVRLHPPRRRSRSRSSRASATPCRPGFDPDRDLQHIGLANQTTMLMSESLQVQELFRQAMIDRLRRRGALPTRFRAFDTICSATQDRQDAVVALLKEKPVDLMIVIGGYNSSNTCNLARMCAEKVPTFHIADPDCLESADAIRYRPAGGKSEVRADGVAARRARLSVGLTSGASTPDNLVGTTVRRLAELCGDCRRYRQSRRVNNPYTAVVFGVSSRQRSLPMRIILHVVVHLRRLGRGRGPRRASRGPQLAAAGQVAPTPTRRPGRRQTGGRRQDTCRS